MPVDMRAFTHFRHSSLQEFTQRMIRGGVVGNAFLSSDKIYSAIRLDRYSNINSFYLPLKCGRPASSVLLSIDGTTVP
jgi:hypothetical protein